VRRVGISNIVAALCLGLFLTGVTIAVLAQNAPMRGVTRFRSDRWLSLEVFSGDVSIVILKSTNADSLSRAVRVWERLACGESGWRLLNDASQSYSTCINLPDRRFIAEAKPACALYPGLRYVLIHFPIWAFVCAVAVFPTGVIATRFIQRRRRRKRSTFQRCTRCGYDLTLNVSGTCPECGVACNLPMGKSVAVERSEL